MYSLLQDLVAPDKPSDKSFADLKESLKAHYEPKQKVISERFRFHQRSQGVAESAVEFVAEPRKLSKTSNFGDYITG